MKKKIHCFFLRVYRYFKASTKISSLAPMENHLPEKPDSVAMQVPLIYFYTELDFVSLSSCAFFLLFICYSEISSMLTSLLLQAYIDMLRAKGKKFELAKRFETLGCRKCLSVHINSVLLSRKSTKLALSF